MHSQQKYCGVRPGIGLPNKEQNNNNNNNNNNHYPQKLALTSPTSGGRMVGIVRTRTQATEFSLV
jgi:hypothetical protein